MSWTLALLLCIAAYFVVVLFNNTFHIFQRKAFVYPSEAEIDQMLPPEVIETIMMNTDIETLSSCAVVSKYWRHHAEKETVVKEVLKKERPIRTDLNVLWSDIAQSNRYKDIQPKDIVFLAYNDNYKPQWNAQDRRFIEKTGKKFLDLEYDSLVKLRLVLKHTADGRGDEFLHEYVARTRLEYISYSQDMYRFYDPKSYVYVHFPPNVLPRRITDNLYTHAQIELVEEFAVFSGQYETKLSNPSLIRVLETRKFFGSVPIDASLFALMYLLFTPCIIKDLWNASDTARYYTNIIFANIGLFGTIITSALIMSDFIYSVQAPRKRAAKQRLGLLVFAELILSLIFYKWMLEFGFYCGLLVGCLIFAAIFLGMNQERHPLSKQMMVISFCLVVSIVDWKSTVDAVRSGDIWLPLLYNLMQHLFVSLWSLFTMASGSIILSKGEFNRAAFKLDKEFVHILLFSLISDLYITCASPYTTRKVFW